MAGLGRLKLPELGAVHSASMERVFGQKCPGNIYFLDQFLGHKDQIREGVGDSFLSYELLFISHLSLHHELCVSEHHPTDL